MQFSEGGNMFLVGTKSTFTIPLGGSQVTTTPPYERTAQVLAQAWGRWWRLGAKANEADDLKAHTSKWATEIAKAHCSGNTTATRSNILVAVRTACILAIDEQWEFDRLKQKVATDLKAYGVYM
jgi:hypothetical protein